MTVDRIFVPEPIGRPVERPVPQKRQAGTSFRDALAEATRAGELKFSAHAQRRLDERQIILSPQDLAKIRDAVDLAAAKGARDSLLIYRDLALVASVKNRTVVTAVDSGGDGGVEKVFTNIDSAVIIK